MSLTLGAVADNWGGQPPPRPPPGSVCGVGPEWYKKHEQLQRRLPSDPESFPAPVIVGNEKRSLGVTNLPRLWARGLLSSMGEPCYGLKCACVEPHRTSPYGFFKKGSQCPLQHGADFSCNTAEDGFSVGLAP